MSRALEFDSDKALKAATAIFWTQGYKKASVQSLMKAMKLGESSFYNTYKSKKHLYLLCLENYNSRVTASRIQALKSNKPVSDKIRDFFEIVIEDQIKVGPTKGCMMTNSLAYEVLNDKELRIYVEDQIDAFRALFISIFDEAKSKSELAQSFDSSTVADLFITHLQGIFKISLIQKDFLKMKKQINLLISALGL